MFDCLTFSCLAELSLTISSVPRPSSGVCAAHLTSRLSVKQRASRPAPCLSELSVFINLLYILIIITGRCGRLALALLMSQHRFIYTHRPYWLRAYFLPYWLFMLSRERRRSSRGPVSMQLRRLKSIDPMACIAICAFSLCFIWNLVIWIFLVTARWKYCNILTAVMSINIRFVVYLSDTENDVFKHIDCSSGDKVALLYFYV